MRILYTMPMCAACQERKAELIRQGVAYEERPLWALDRGDIPAAALDAMGLIQVWTERMFAGEPWLVAPVEIERDGERYELVSGGEVSERQAQAIPSAPGGEG